MEGHFGVDAPDFPAGVAKAQAEFGFFAGHDGGIKRADLPEGGDFHHGIAAAAFGGTDGGVPFEIDELIINGTVGVQFPAASANGGEILPGLKVSACGFQPAVDDFAVAVDELNEREVGSDLGEFFQAGIAGPGRGEGLAGIEIDDVSACGSRDAGAAVVASGVYINDGRDFSGERGEAALEAIALVAANGDDADVGQFAQSRRGRHFGERLGEAMEEIDVAQADRGPGEFPPRQGAAVGDLRGGIGLKGGL